MRSLTICIIGFVVSVGAFAQSSHAADRVWNIPGSGNWMTAGNWTPNGLPQDDDRIFAITISPQNIVINFDDSRTPTRRYTSMLIDSNGPGSMTVQQSAFQLSAGTMTIGGGGPGAYVISGGILGSGTFNLTPSGRLSMSGNSSVEAQFFNHNGIVTATGGTIWAGVYTHNGMFDTSGTTEPRISALVSAVEFNANNPTFGGSLRVFNELRLNVATLSIAGDFESRLESYTLPADRTIGVAQDVTINNGTFVQRGNFLTSPGGSVHGGSSDTFIRGGAQWNLQSGTNSGARLFVGSSGAGVASYTMSGAGTSDFKIIQVANETSGAFTHSIGSVKTNSLLVGGGTIGPSSGTYTINSGTLNVAFNTLVGRDGTASGAMKQNGGTVRIDGSLTINENAGSRGTYALSNGTLTVGERTVNHGSFTQTGGVATFNTHFDGAGTVNIAGGTMNIYRLRQRAVAIGGTGVIREWPEEHFETPVHRVESLTFENGPNNTINGTWDIDGTHLVVEYSSASPIVDIQRYIQSGYANGAWTGTGIRSRLAAMMPQGVIGIACVEASQVLGPNGGYFGDLAVDSTALIVRPTYYGDTDLNGQITFDDYARIDFGFNNGGQDWFHGDFNYDGVVNFDDYALIDLAFNTQSLPERTSAVPEPSVTGVCIGICALTAARRRARPS